MRSHLCPDCAAAECARAGACYEAERAAHKRGEIFKCTCSRPKCTHKKSAQHKSVANLHNDSERNEG